MSGWGFDPQDLILRALTGSNRQSLLDASAMGRGPIQINSEGSNTDKALHALTAQRMTDRIGSLPVRILGPAKEYITGFGQAIQGKPFFSPTGFDMSDIDANELGIREAQRRQQSGWGSY